jgi:PAS domain S-box-containing protein
MADLKPQQVEEDPPFQHGPTDDATGVDLAMPERLDEQAMKLLEQQTLEHAIVLIDINGIITRWNPAAERILGYTPDEVLGRSISLIFTDTDNAMGATQHERQIASSVGMAEDDRWHVRKDGAKIWGSGTLTPLRNRSGHLIGYGKIMRDRTDIRLHMTALQAQLAQVNEELERRDHYFAGLAHEIRNALTPLTSVLSILPGGQTDRENTALAVARRQLKVLTKLAQDAASLATIHAGKLHLRREKFELGDWLRGVAASMEEQATRKSQTLEVLPVPGPVMIEADPQRLHQLVFNLLHNAVKYTPPGGKIWLKLTQEDKAAVVRVEDNGIGIDAQLLPKIFDLFAQASVGDSEGGLGVGLSLVRDLARAHGGIVEVRSEGVGKGSEFTLRLPLANQDSAHVGSKENA